MTKLVYKKKVAAKMLDISTATIDRLRKQGLIQSKKIGGQIMFTEQALQEYLDNN